MGWHFPNRLAEKIAENFGFEEITDLFADYAILALNWPKIDVFVPQQRGNTIHVTIILRKVTATLGITEISQQEKTTKSMALRKSPIIAPNLQFRPELFEN